MQIPENLWICLLCAHVGCGRYTKEHAKQHFHQTGHILSLELATGEPQKWGRGLHPW